MDNKIMSKRPYEKKCSKEFIYACKNGDIETVKKLLKYNKYLVYDFDQVINKYIFIYSWGEQD